MAFSENLYYLRKKAKITQEELAAELDVSRQSVSKWETGEAYPETEKLVAICDKFGVSLDAMVRGDIAAEESETSVTEESVQPAPTDCASANTASTDTADMNECVVKPDGEERKARDRKSLKRAAVYSAVSSAIMLCALIAYLVCGFVYGIWGVSSVAFVYGLSLCSVVHCFFGGEEEDDGDDEDDDEGRGGGRRTKFQRISASLSGGVMLLCVAVYLTLGLALGLWHPSWIIFIIGVAVCTILGVLSGDDFRKDKN